MRVEILLTAVVGLGALSIDMFLPSLPAIAAAFDAPPATVQLTVTLFLMAFAASQLVYGPLSDRFGRRWVLIVGLALYAVAGLACALAPTIGILIGARVLQALGGGAGPVVARAVIRDLYERERAARVFSYMAMVQSLNPMLAPVLGGYVHETLGWRAVFYVLTGAGSLFVILIAAGVHETNIRRDPTALQPGAMGRNVAVLLTDRAYLAYVLVNALMFGGQFAFISGSAFVLIGVLGAERLRPLLRRGRARDHDRDLSVRALRRAARARPHDPRRHRLGRGGPCRPGRAGVGRNPFGHGHRSSDVPLRGRPGLTLPNGMAGAIGRFPRMAGLAAAVAGFLQMTGSALYSVAVSRFYDGTARPMTAAIALAGVAALGCFWRLRLRPRPAVLA